MNFLLKKINTVAIILLVLVYRTNNNYNAEIILNPSW